MLRACATGTRRRMLALCAAALLSCALLLHAAPAYAETPLARYAGQSALDTMQQVAEQGFGQSDVVVVASADGYWDALAASALAGAFDAPVLLTSSGSLSQQTEAAVRELGAKHAFVVGGPMSVSEGAFDALDKLVGTVVRVSGENARETATAVAAYLTVHAPDQPGGQAAEGEEPTDGARADGARADGSTPAEQAAPIERAIALPEGFALPKTCIITTSDTFQDALSASPFAWSASAPIFLAEPGGGALSEASLAAVQAAGFERALIAGGTMSVAKSVEDQLRGAALDVVRLAGADCYATSIEVATWEVANGMSWAHVGAATATTYHDALAGATLCGRSASPLLLVDKRNLSAVRSCVDANRGSISTILAFGGEQSVVPLTERRLRGISPEDVIDAIAASARSEVDSNPEGDGWRYELALIRAGGVLAYGTSGNWCGALCWYAVRQAGYADTWCGGQPFSDPQQIAEYYMGQGSYRTGVAGMQRGDIIFSYYSGAPEGLYISHVGICMGTTSDTIDIFDGNPGVRWSTVSKSYPYIVGYARPEY